MLARAACGPVAWPRARQLRWMDKDRQTSATPVAGWVAGSRRLGGRPITGDRNQMRGRGCQASGAVRLEVSPLEPRLGRSRRDVGRGAGAATYPSVLFTRPCPAPPPASTAARHSAAAVCESRRPRKHNLRLPAALSGGVVGWRSASANVTSSVMDHRGHGPSSSTFACSLGPTSPAASASRARCRRCSSLCARRVGCARPHQQKPISRTLTCGRHLARARRCP